MSTKLREDKNAGDVLDHPTPILLRYTKYNLRSRLTNLEQSGYNNKFLHNSLPI